MSEYTVHWLNGRTMNIEFNEKYLTAGEVLFEIHNSSQKPCEFTLKKKGGLEYGLGEEIPLGTKVYCCLKTRSNWCRTIYLYWYLKRMISYDEFMKLRMN